ncbi:MAG: glucose-6-phosphate dehydrogenase [Chloroflexi bacterium]|nr:glucose-6-phosphate dehydrogenase [Chloroflexota bacterium]
MSLDPPAPQDVVIVGASGDLSRRKLLPALYNLAAAGLLHSRGGIIGLAPTDLDDERFREFARESIRQFSRTGFDEKSWDGLSSRLTFVRLDEAGYQRLAERADESERLVYLAVPPSAVPEIVRNLGGAGLASGTRLVIEKPFGRDTASAKELNSTIHDSFDESQVFRIDHYLGKETVQNIMVFRFGNAVFERVWNRDAIDHMQITVAESIGVEGRGAFYEEAGALRDIVQNHVFQVLSLLAMEPPVSLAPEAVRDEKAKVFRAMRPLDPARTVRGQYTAGTIDGEAVPGYREERGVAPDSATETFFAAQVEIDSWRWAGVPFYLRTGKRLPRRATEVSVVFRDVPLCFFEGTDVQDLRPNHLVLRIQPEEGINFNFFAKQPGPQVSAQQVSMDFSYRDSFMTEPAEAYERLLHDAMDGDHTLFAREDSVERGWMVVQPALENPAPVRAYPAGSWGPPEADNLIAPRAWHLR